MTPEQKESRRAKLRDLFEQSRAQFVSAVEGDPFWYYEPSDGVVSEDAHAFLRKWLKVDDIPQGKLDCQLDVHLSESRTIAASGGNRAGKSVSACIEAFIWMTGKLPKSLEGIYPESKLPTSWPVMGRVVCVDFKTMSNTVVPTYQKWVPREYLKGGKWSEAWSSEHKVLTLEKDGKHVGSLEFMTNQQGTESFQGPERHFVIYDEEPRYDVYRENLLRMATTGVRQIFGMTPTKGLSWTYELFSRGEDSEGHSIDWFRIPNITNKRVKLDVLDGILKDLTSYDEIKMRLLGEFVSLSGLVYGNAFSEKTHVIEPFPLTDNYYVVRGIDPHLVKPTVCVEAAIDREENVYIVGLYSKDTDTAVIKEDLATRANDRRYRLGWSICDKSANSTIKVLGDRNAYLELSRGKDAMPALFTSDKYTGSIMAGVDEIKKRLKVDEKTGQPRLFIFNIPENRLLIQAMKTMERDMGQNEEKNGVRDKILEGKHDAHAAMRYIFQRPIRWLAPDYGKNVVEPPFVDADMCW